MHRMIITELFLITFSIILTETDKTLHVLCQKTFQWYNKSISSQNCIFQHNFEQHIYFRNIQINPTVDDEATFAG